LTKRLRSDHQHVSKSPLSSNLHQWLYKLRSHLKPRNRKSLNRRSKWMQRICYSTCQKLTKNENELN